MEWVILGSAVALAVTKLQEPSYKKERIQICNALQEYYTKEKFTPEVFAECIQSGPEKTLYYNLNQLK